MVLGSSMEAAEAAEGSSPILAVALKSPGSLQIAEVGEETTSAMDNKQ